jgi:hypothetical protein
MAFAILKNSVVFTAIGPGATVSLPHGLNISGRAVRPDHCESDNAVVLVQAGSTDETDVTVTNTSAAPANANVLCERWHSTDRALPPGVENLTPQPFVPGVGTSGGGGDDLYAPPEKWEQQNIAASQAGVALSAMMSTSFDTLKMIRAGSIVGLSTRLTAAITDATPNSVVITVTKNGAPGTLSLGHSSGSNPIGGEAAQASGVDTFVAGDLLGIEITTLGSFTPINTLDIEAWLDLQF